ncbi:MAG: cupin domain-containing protein [Bryobacteraceae bacterium]
MDRFCSWAALYAVGMLAGDEVRGFEGHLAEGCANCRSELTVFREIAAEVPLDLPPQQTPPRVREELRRKIRSGGGSPRGPGGLLHVVRAGGGTWVESGWDGVRVKSLYHDAERKVRTMLVRIAPGASLPPHVHKATEQCLVLEGDVYCEDLALTAGDYQCLPAQGRHEKTGSVNGCLLLLMTSDHNEFLT